MYEMVKTHQTISSKSTFHGMKVRELIWLMYIDHLPYARHYSSTLAWKIPWMEEPGGLQSMGSLRVGHDCATSLSLFTVMHWRRKWQPIPVFLPGESQGRVPSLRSHRVGNDWSNLAAAAAADTLSMWTILWHVDSYLVHPCLMAFGLNYSATGRGRRYSFYSSYVPEPDESYLI